MYKKWTSFLALFLAFAMAITGMPANYAVAVETVEETETEFEEVSEEALEDEDLDDEDIEDDSEIESDDVLLETEVEEEKVENANGLPAMVGETDTWSQIGNLQGGELTFNPDSDAFEDPYVELEITDRTQEGWGYLRGEDSPLRDKIIEDTGYLMA